MDNIYEHEGRMFIFEERSGVAESLDPHILDTACDRCAVSGNRNSPVCSALRKQLLARGDKKGCGVVKWTIIYGDRRIPDVIRVFRELDPLYADLLKVKEGID